MLYQEQGETFYYLFPSVKPSRSGRILRARDLPGLASATTGFKGSRSLRPPRTVQAGNHCFYLSDSNPPAPPFTKRGEGIWRVPCLPAGRRSRALNPVGDDGVPATLPGGSAYAVWRKKHGHERERGIRPERRRQFNQPRNFRRLVTIAISSYPPSGASYHILP